MRRYVVIVTFSDLMVTSCKFLWTRYTFSGIRFFYHGNTNLIIRIALITSYNLHINIYRDYLYYLSLSYFYCLGIIADMNSLRYQVTIECMTSKNQPKREKKSKHKQLENFSIFQSFKCCYWYYLFIYCILHFVYLFIHFLLFLFFV